MDGSKGVSEQLYSRQKDFVKALATQFYVSPNGPRASGAAYGEDVSTIVDFNENDFARKISEAKLIKTPRRIERVLQHAAQMFASRGKDGPKIVVLLTAGSRQQDSRLIESTSERLRNLGTKIYVVAMGVNHSPQQLNAITPSAQDVFRITSPDNLLSYVRPVAKSSKCNVNVIVL